MNITDDELRKEIEASIKDAAYLIAVDIIVAMQARRPVKQRKKIENRDTSKWTDDQIFWMKRFKRAYDAMNYALDPKDRFKEEHWVDYANHILETSRSVTTLRKALNDDILNQNRVKNTGEIYSLDFSDLANKLLTRKYNGNT